MFSIWIILADYILREYHIVWSLAVKRILLIDICFLICCFFAELFTNRAFTFKKWKTFAPFFDILWFYWTLFDAKFYDISPELITYQLIWLSSFEGTNQSYFCLLHSEMLKKAMVCCYAKLFVTFSYFVIMFLYMSKDFKHDSSKVKNSGMPSTTFIYWHLQNQYWKTRSREICNWQAVQGDVEVEVTWWQVEELDVRQR